MLKAGGHCIPRSVFDFMFFLSHHNTNASHQKFLLLATLEQTDAQE